MKQTLWAASFAALLVLVSMHAADAQTVGALDTLVGSFQSRVSAFGGTLTNAAEDLFRALVGIEIVWIIGTGLLARVDWSEMFGAILRLLFSVGLLWYGLIHWPDIASSIVNSFGILGNNASVAAGGSANYSPSDVFSSGLNMASALWHGLSIYNPGLSILLAIAGIILVIIYAIVIALMIEVLVESLFVAYAGIIMMGFGGTRYTRPYAEAQFRYAISVGVKRLVLQLLIGVCETMMMGWANNLAAGSVPSWQDIGVVIGLPVVLLNLVLKLPYKAQDMVNGQTSHGGSGLLGTAGMVGAAAAGAAIGAAGAGSAIGSAFSLANQQGQSQSGGGGEGSGGAGGSSSGGGGEAGGATASGFVTQAAMMSGRAARNLASSGAQDIGRRLTGGYGALHGHRGFRMASSMNQQRRALKAEAEDGGPKETS